MTDPHTTIERAEAEIGTFYVAAKRFDAPGGYALRADRVVPIASMFKVLLALEVAEAFACSTAAPEERVQVTGEAHCPGGLGLNQFTHPVTLSLYDILYLSLAMSDNTASDLLLDRIGIDALHRRADVLGLTTVRITGDCHRLLTHAGADFGYPTDADAVAADWAPPSDAADLVLERTTRASMADLCRLAELIATDAAASSAACRTVAELMSRQIWTTRFASVFTGPKWTLSSKTGTLSPWRGELGVVSGQDGSRFALAVAVRQHHADAPGATVDAAVAAVAASAITLASATRATA